MTIIVSISDIDTLKAKLAELIPQVQSSHRVEAMARGLGWQTNAALRDALKDKADERSLTEHAFDAYLVVHGFSVAPGVLARAVAQSYLPDRTAILRVMNQEPLLTRFGIGVYRDPKMTPEQRRQEFQNVRGQLLGVEGLREFSRAVEFLGYYTCRKTINPKAFSYGLKHAAERYHREQGNSDNYVSNGALIAAAIHLGVDYRIDGPNAYFNMGLRQNHPVEHCTHIGECRSARPRRQPAQNPRRIAWSNMMIAAINAGLDQGIYGLDAGDNRWTGDDTICRFIFAGLPAIACVRDAGFDELVIQVAVNPTANAGRWIRAINAGLDTGDAIALGWLERRKGKWLQTSEGRPVFASRRHLLPLIVNTKPEPRGYVGHGKFMM